MAKSNWTRKDITRLKRWGTICLLQLKTSVKKPLFPLLILQDEKIILKTETACFYPRAKPLSGQQWDLQEQHVPGTFWDQTNWSCCLDAKWMEKFINAGFGLLLLTFSLPPLPLRRKENIFQLSQALGILPIWKSDHSFKEKNKHIYSNNLATFPVLRFWQTFNKEICKWHGFLWN